MISTPSVLRNLRITAYMAHSCPIPTVKSFADATPFAVLFHDVAVLVHTNEPFPPNHIFAVLNCTFIALCVRNSVDQSKVVGFFFFFSYCTFSSVVLNELVIIQTSLDITILHFLLLQNFLRTF